MPRLNFGAFLAPHNPVGENPLLRFRRDLDLVERLDKLGYDEFWLSRRSGLKRGLSRTPAPAPRPVPTMIDIGVASPRAQGQVIMRTAAH